MHQMNFCNILNITLTNIMYISEWEETYRCIINTCAGISISVFNKIFYSFF